MFKIKEVDMHNFVYRFTMNKGEFVEVGFEVGCSFFFSFTLLKFSDCWVYKYVWVTLSFVSSFYDEI